MSTEDEIRGQFDMFNVKPSEEVITKCLKLCETYNIDGEDLVDQWFAYTSSKLRGANPTVEYLEQMERKELMKQEQIVKKPVSSVQSVVAPSSKSIVSEDHLSTPKGNHAPATRIQTPIQTRNLLDETILSPSNPSKTYSKRTDALSVRFSHGTAKENFKRTFNFELVVHPFYSDDLKHDQRFMYEVLQKRRRCIDSMTEELVEAIILKYDDVLSDWSKFKQIKYEKQWNEWKRLDDKKPKIEEKPEKVVKEDVDVDMELGDIEPDPKPAVKPYVMTDSEVLAKFDPEFESEPEFKPKLEQSLEPKSEIISNLKPTPELEMSDTFFYGRIVSDANGKINSQSVILEQTVKFNGACYFLNLSNLSKYSLFCGQVVVVQGHRLKSSKREMLVVEGIYSDTNFSLLKDPPLVKDTLQMVVACGPFTPQDNLSFEPLADLLKYVKQHQPHVLLLTGPFYHKDHQGIMNGELRQSLDTFFFDLVENIMLEVPTNTHVIIVSSHKEPHHYPVYPTPPYAVREKYLNLTFMPDPSMIYINGLIVGATTADILFDIGSYEMHVDKTSSAPSDRMGRLASYVLKQQSFYPLDPPSKEMCIDFSLMERHGVMEVKPHVLILPSILRYFVKEIDNTVIINPEKLTKGNGGGTFARLEISPGSNQTVCGRTACEILKI